MALVSRMKAFCGSELSGSDLQRLVLLSSSCLPLRTLAPARRTTNHRTVTPLGDRVLVRRMDAEETSAGGIILPDSAKEKPAEGTIIAVGAGRLDENGDRQTMTVKVKDHVLFSSYAGSEIKLDGENYLIMGEDEILAVID